jgi:alpha-beta hydrolase superfamily lysophospholipase
VIILQQISEAVTSANVSHRTIEANGIRLHIAEQGEGPAVLLCHGFPESWYSWRHQLAALAAAGFHAIAPDMRGYGRSDRPEAIEQYTLLHLVGDMVGLLDAWASSRRRLPATIGERRLHGMRLCCAPTAFVPSSDLAFLIVRGLRSCRPR